MPHGSMPRVASPTIVIGTRIQARNPNTNPRTSAAPALSRTVGTTAANANPLTAPVASTPSHSEAEGA